jgi:purine-binding chemotaxis protein CheW
MTGVTTLEKDASMVQTRDFLTIWISEQIFGIPILQVQDVLGEQAVTKIPLSPPSVAGSLNLRGRIVTAINVRACLGLPPNQNATRKDMSVVVENGGELYSLMIDKVGDVLSLASNNFEKTPSTLDPKWQDISAGIYRLKDKLLVVLDVPKLLADLNPNK